MGIYGTDRVQPVKWESTNEGGSSDEPFPSGANPQQDALGVRGMYLQPALGDRDEDVYVLRDGDDLKFNDKNNTEKTLADLVAGTGGLTVEGHKILRQLIHFIDDGPAEGFTSGAYKETTGTVFPSAIIWWESSSKLKKIISVDVTWSSALVTQEVWKVYDTDGSTVLATVTDVITYSGVFETSRTRTIA
jgi:hypothetical protein